MNNVSSVTMRESAEYLKHKLCGVVFSEVFQTLDFFEKVRSIAELGRNDKVFLLFNYFIDLHDIGMILHNAYEFSKVLDFSKN